jgi:hypothetical protein
MQGAKLRLQSIVRVFALVGLMLSAALVFAQDNILDVHGTIKNDANRKNMDKVTVSVKQNGKDFDAFTTTSNGKYGFNLPLGHLYTLTFTADGFVKKKIELNTKGIPPEDMAGGFKLNMDMTLFAYQEGFNTELMEKPLGKAAFDPIRNSVEFDYDYTARMQKEIADEFKRLAKMEKEMEKLLKEFNDLIVKGDQAMTGGKFAEAVSKFEAATKVIPNREPAPTKLAEAQAALDAENAAKELEQRYNNLIASAKADIGKQKWKEAREAATEAGNLKPNEREPKDLLANIEKELEAIEKRARYDQIVANADKEFNAKNYAISIDKYEEALKLFPAEKYPSDQIKAARKFIDEQLAAAADEEARNKRYNELIKSADGNVDRNEYEAAINKYKEALDVKPEEKYPKDRIKYVEDLIAKAKKAESDALAAADKAERDALEKQYRDIVKRADDRFKAKKLSEAREDYVAASALKPDENYPKTRIERIDELLAEADAKAKSERQANDAASREEAEYQAIIQAADKKFDDGDLEGAKLDYASAQLVRPNDKYPKTRVDRINEMLAKQKSADDDRLAEERRRKEEERLAREEADRLAREERMKNQDSERERRRREEEEERARLAEERARKAEEERRRLSDFANNASSTSEDDAERYYREARRRDEMAKKDNVESIKTSNAQLMNDRQYDAQARVQARQEEMSEVEGTMTRIFRDGNMRQEEAVVRSEREKQKLMEREADLIRSAERRIEGNVREVERLNEEMTKLAENDLRREQRIEEVAMRHQDHVENIAAYQSRGDAQRVNNEYDVKRQREKLRDMSGEGENIRLNNVDRKEEEKMRFSSAERDIRRAAEERRALEENNVDTKKEQMRDVGEGKDLLVMENIEEVERRKNNDAVLRLDREAEARNRAYDKRKELFDLDAGSEKDVDDYLLPLGAENLEEGVQEKSYEEGNKMIIERIVRRGNKVDTYRKVISKTGIYYFKNGQSITETLWKRETLQVGS